MVDFFLTGSDKNVYPPMSTQLEQAGIRLDQGFEVEHLNCEPDLIVVGTHGRHGIGLLLGSTANSVLHGVDRDVLAVRVSVETS